MGVISWAMHYLMPSIRITSELHLRVGIRSRRRNSEFAELVGAV